MKTRLTALFVTVAALGLAGCSHKGKVADLPPNPGGAGVAQGESQSDPAITPGSAADFLAQMNGRNVIYFDTDRFDIDEVDVAALRTQAQWLLKYPERTATIEGHCDERGTREYNLALGARRANAAKNYLASLGIDAARLSTVSYGKERPAALGSDEQAWAQNRRAVTIAID